MYQDFLGTEECNQVPAKAQYMLIRELSERFKAENKSISDYGLPLFIPADELQKNS